jgi:hypothetical protein
VITVKWGWINRIALWYSVDGVRWNEEEREREKKGGARQGRKAQLSSRGCNTNGS